MPLTPDQWVANYKITSLDLSQEDLSQYMLTQVKATALSSVPKPQNLAHYNLNQPPLNTSPDIVEYNNWVKTVKQAQSEALDQYLTQQPKPQPLNLPLSPAQVKAEYQQYLGGYKPVYQNNVNDLVPGIKEVFVKGAQQNLLEQGNQNLANYFEQLPSNTPSAQNSVTAPKAVSPSALPGQTNPPAPSPAPPLPVSPAALPPTPASAGIQQAVDVLNGELPKPPPAVPKTSLSLPNSAPKALPSSLPPNTASLLAVGAGLQFVGAVAAGQSPGQAAVGATGGFVGGALGTVLGTPFGPIGQLIGGTVGSYTGSAITNGIWGLINPSIMPAPATVNPDPLTGPLLFTGGQCTGQYDIGYTLAINRPDGVSYTAKNTGRFWGPIGGFRVNKFSPGPGAPNGTDVFEVLCHGGVSYYASSPRSETQIWVQQNFDSPNMTIVSINEIKYLNGADNCGNPAPQPIPAPTSAPATINYNTTVVNNGGPSAPPSATPAAGQNPKPSIYIPAWNPSLSNGTANPDLSPDWIPNGNPAGSPGYQNQPTNLGGDLPGTALPITPGLSTGNTATPWMADNPATDQVFPQFQPAFTPTVLTPNPLTAGSLSTNPDPISFSIPSGLPSTAKSEPVPDATSPVPKAQSAPAPMPVPFKDPAMEEFQTKLDDLTNMMLPIVAFTTAFQGVPNQLTNIQNQTTPQAIQNAAAAGTCSTLQPGGCMLPLANNAQNAANSSATNNNLLNGINTGLNAVQLPLLNTIDTKLGPQITNGGISGFLGRLSKSLGIDRIFNLINFTANLHNALMLSANLKVTLLEMLSSVGNATGLLQTSEGDNVDLNQVFNQGAEIFISSIIGEENYAGLKVAWRKYNRIYQAAANSLNAISNMFNSIANGIETIGEYTGKIGNSLKAAGQVFENAYQWMAEKMDVKMSRFIRFESTVGNVTQVLEAINEVAETVVEGQEAYTEMQKANTEFLKELKEAQKNPGLGSDAIQEEMALQKENATKDPTGEDEDGLLSFLTDF